MYRSLQARLSHIQTDFLLAINRGPSALLDFYKAWSLLQKDVVTAHTTGCLTDETLVLSGVVAAKMEMLAESFLGVEVHVGRLAEEPVSELNSVVPCSLSTHNGLPSAASKWLLHHLDDPYPSKDDKSSLATHAATTVKLVDSWFTNARRSIGWTTLSQSFFAGSRAATSAAARQVYGDGPMTPDITSEVAYAFLTVKFNAEKMHSQNLETQASHPVEAIFKDRSLGGAVVREPVGVDYGEGTYFPFPDEPSFSSFPTAIIHDSDEEEDTTPPPPVAGHKRRVIEYDPSSDAEHVNSKRPRLQRSVSVPSPQCKATPSPTPKRRLVSTAACPKPPFDGSPVSSLPVISQQCLDVDVYLGICPEIASSTVATASSPASTSPSSKPRVCDNAGVIEPQTKRLRSLPATSSPELPNSSNVWSGLWDIGGSSYGGASSSLELSPIDHTMPLDMAFLNNWNLVAPSAELSYDDKTLTSMFGANSPLSSAACAEGNTMTKYPPDLLPAQSLPFLSPAHSVSSLGTSVSGDDSLWESSDGDAFSCSVGWDSFEDFIRSLTPDSEASSTLPSPQSSSTKLLTEEPTPPDVVGESDIWSEFCVDF